MVELIEAAHILNGTEISVADLNKAKTLLNSLVQEFEQIYGQTNMVYNVHLLLHTAKCVEKNGPLFCYSNYATEDNLGHLLSFVHGRTDVLSQISDRYLQEKRMHSNVNNSIRAQNYYNNIKHRQLKIICNLNDSLLVGKAQVLNPIDRDWVIEQLELINIEPMYTHRAVYVSLKIYFESYTNKTAQKLTYDSFICDPTNNIFGELKTILTINNEIYFIIHNKYKVKANSRDLGTILIELEEKTDCDVINKFIMLPNSIKTLKKYAFMKTDNMLACSKFPNLIERN